MKTISCTTNTNSMTAFHAEGEMLFTAYGGPSAERLRADERKRCAQFWAEHARIAEKK